MRNNSEISQFSRRAAIAVGLSALAIILLLAFHLLAQVLLMGFAAVLLAIFLDAPTTFLEKRTRLNREWALACVVVILLLLTTGSFWVGGAEIEKQAAAFADEIPKAFEKLKQALSGNELGRRVLTFVSQPGKEGMGAEGLNAFAGILSLGFGLISGIVVVIFCGVYGANNPSIYVDSLILLFPKSHRKRAKDIANAMGTALHRWLLGRLIIMAIVGIVTMVSFWIIQLPSAFMLGLISGILAFIPYIGAIAAAVPAILIGFTVSPSMAFYAFLVYTVTHMIEGYVVTPLIENRVVSLPPALVLFGQVISGALFGVLGVVFATPLMVVLIIVIQMTYLEKVIGDHVKPLGNEKESLLSTK